MPIWHWLWRNILALQQLKSHILCYFFFLSAKKRLYVLIVSNSWWKYYTTSSSQIPWKIFHNLFWRRKKFLPSSPSKKTDSHFRKIWSFFSVKKFRRRDGSQFEIWLLSLCLKCRFTYLWSQIYHKYMEGGCENQF